MKKIIYILALISVLPFTAQSRHFVGVKGAFGINSLDINPAADIGSLKTFNPGIVYRFEKTKTDTIILKSFFTAVQAEVNLINKGYIMLLDTAKKTPETTHTITSVEVPFMGQIYMKAGNFRPYVTGGVFFGYILDRETKIADGDLKKYVYDQYDRRFEYGIAGGAGIGYEFSRFYLQGEWRYHYNFSSLRKPVIPVNDGSGKNTVVYMNTTQMMISLSLFYRLSK